jgi:hypothetical protein
MQLSGKTPLSLALAGLVFTVPRLASAADCLDVKVCVRWKATLVDHDHGNISLPTAVPAVGTVVTLLRPAPEEPVAGVLDAEGCLSFQTQFADGHKLIIKAEAEIGEPNNVHLTTSRKATSIANVEPSPIWLRDRMASQTAM